MQATITQILAALKAADTIIIHRHQNPDPDAFGSQGGLAAALTAAYPEKTVLKAGEPDAGLAWITTPDAVPAEAYANAAVVVIDTANQPRIAGAHWQVGVQ